LFFFTFFLVNFFLKLADEVMKPSLRDIMLEA
jgi:hypothetical protein